jgi:hypothetical protein
MSVGNHVTSNTTIDAVGLCKYPVLHASQGTSRRSGLRMTARPVVKQTKRKFFQTSISISAVRG